MRMRDLLRTGVWVNIALLRGAAVACALAMGLFHAGAAWACSSTDPAARRSLTCGLLLLSSIDSLQGLLLPEWEATFAVLRSFEDRYDRAEEALVVPLEAQILERLSPLSEAGNPAAQLTTGVFLRSPTKAAARVDDPQVKRQAAQLILRAAAAGSDSALVTAVGMFRTTPRPSDTGFPEFGDLLEADTIRCWNAIDTREPPGGSPRDVEIAWVASRIRPQATACVAATLRTLGR